MSCDTIKIMIMQNTSQSGLSELEALFKSDSFQLLQTKPFQQIYQIYSEISKIIRGNLDSQEFLEFKPPLIGPVTDPGTRGSKQVEIDFYGKSYKFMSSAILYKQYLAISRKHSGYPGKIYFFADNLRMEPLETASTDRHLSEFVQVDLELVDADHFDAMNVAESLVKSIYSGLKPHSGLVSEVRDYFRPFSRERGLIDLPTEIKVPSTFKKITHEEAVEMLQVKLSEDKDVRGVIQRLFRIKPNKLSKETELHWEYEWLLSSMFKEPFFIHDYPRGARGFYDREYPQKPGYLMDFDLIFPYGYGEAISGAAREFDYKKVIPRMKESGENLKKYQWYLKFLQMHGEPTSGFGIGLERTVRFFCGLPKVYFALPYPKVPGMYNP